MQDISKLTTGPRHSHRISAAPESSSSPLLFQHRADCRPKGSSSTFGQTDLTAETIRTWPSVWVIAKRVASDTSRYKDAVLEIGTL